MSIYMVNKYMKMCSTSIVIREMKIKTTLICNFTSTGMTINEKTITSLGENVEKLESSNTASKNVNQCNHFGKEFDSSSKQSYHVTQHFYS